MIYNTQITNEIINCFDPETGEVFNEEAYSTLCKGDETIAENLALEIKNRKAEIKVLKEEIALLQSKMEASENKKKQVTELLRFVLKGEKLKTPLVSVYYKSTKSVEADADFDKLTEINPDFVRIRKDYNKTEIKKAIEAGQEVPGCQIVEKQSLIVR
ncbi:MAG: siphovirus Gp157 family protein [Eubacteriaceae bacterium]|nr:siphovirus Gp157 family protein [Eubacteriaceae bacterium]